MRSGRQWLGIDWAPWRRGGGGGLSPLLMHPLPHEHLGGSEMTPGPEIREKVKMAFLEPAQRGHSERSSFAWYLVEQNHFCPRPKKKFEAFGARV